MTATYTFDVFSSLDGFGGYWGKQGPELLDHRLALYEKEQRMIFGANMYRLFTQMVAESAADGRRPRRPRPGDALPCDHRSDRR